MTESEDTKCMITDKQLAANRANAQKSTGPRSVDGKQRSRLNATRHGLAGHVTVLPDEDREAFNNFASKIVESFAPADANESQLAHCYASYMWRINRAAAIEENIFTLGNIEGLIGNLDLEHAETHNALSSAKTFLAEARELDRLSLYNQRLVNSALKILKQLEHAQAERRKREDTEVNEVLNIYNIHKSQNAAFDPQQHGFVLTRSKVEDLVHRRSLQNPSYVAQLTRKQRAKAA